MLKSVMLFVYNKIMKEHVKKLISESSDVSSMRVMSFMTLGFSYLITVIALVMNKDLGDISMLAGVFVGSAFTGKAVQKFSEIKRGVE